MTETAGTHMHQKGLKWHSLFKTVKKKNRGYSEQFRTETTKKKNIECLEQYITVIRRT
jgi:hypothetical protein